MIPETGDLVVHPDLAWTDVDAGSISVATSSFRAVAIFDRLALVLVRLGPGPARQTLADVHVGASLYALGLQGGG